MSDRRETMQASLEQSLSTLREGLAEDLKSRVDATLDVQQQRRQALIEGHFHPLRRMGDTSSFDWHRHGAGSVDAG